MPLFWADLLLFIHSYLFSFINSSSGSGFPGAEVFVPSTNPPETSTRCQQLQGDPKSLNPDHPSHREERVKGNFCNKSSSLHLPFISDCLYPCPKPSTPCRTGSWPHLGLGIFVILEEHGIVHRSTCLQALKISFPPRSLRENFGK